MLKYPTVVQNVVPLVRLDCVCRVNKHITEVLLYLILNLF